MIQKTTTMVNHTNNTLKGDKPIPGRAADCKDCPASAFWPWYGAGLWCFHAAYFLGKAGKPKLCKSAKLHCPEIKK